METFAQLESYSNELVAAVKSLKISTFQGTDADSLIDSEVHSKADQAKQTILSNIAKIKILIHGPTDFLKHLAVQGGVVGCLRWLGEFQILACIPLTGSVPIKDVADLSGVSEVQLSRTIHLTATAGFLEEVRPGHVAHTALSAPFVTQPCFLDAAMFLAELASPAVLQTETQTRTQTGSPPKLRRQWSAYLDIAGGLRAAEDVADNLTQLNWANIASTGIHAGVVEIGAQSTMTARTITALNPALHFQIQLKGNSSSGEVDPHIAREREREVAQETELSPRITVTTRPIGIGVPQSVTDAAVYILHLPDMPSAILSELKDHIGVLRSSNGVMLLLTARLLPEPGSIADHPEIEATIRARDFALRQLTSVWEMEMVDLLDMIDEVSDDAGKLVVINKLRSCNNVVFALAVKYVDHGLGRWSSTGAGGAVTLGNSM